MGFVAIFIPEGDGHYLELAPCDAGKGLVVVLGYKDAVTAPTARFGFGAAAGHYIPHFLGLRGEGQAEADIDAAKEGDCLAHLNQVRRFWVSEGQQRITGEAVLLPVVQHVKLNAAVIGLGVAGHVTVPLLVVGLNRRVGNGNFGRAICCKHLDGMADTGDGAATQGVVHHHAP